MPVSKSATPPCLFSCSAAMSFPSSWVGVTSTSGLEVGAGSALHPTSGLVLGPSPRHASPRSMAAWRAQPPCYTTALVLRRPSDPQPASPPGVVIASPPARSHLLALSSSMRDVTYAFPAMTMRPTSFSGFALSLLLKRMWTASACAASRVAVESGNRRRVSKGKGSGAGAGLAPSRRGGRRWRGWWRGEDVRG